MPTALPKVSAAGQRASKLGAFKRARPAAGKLPDRLPTNGAHVSKSGKIFDIRERRVVKLVARRKSPTPLPFYAVVQIRNRQAVPQAVRGQHGVVVGRARNSRGGWAYSVAIRDADGSYYLPHATLKPTGNVLKREDLYKGDKLRVRVDALGNGEIV
jgi:hypothetical protein